MQLDGAVFLYNPHPVQIGVRVFRHVIVEDNIDSLDVHSSAKKVSGHQDPPLEVLELLIAREPARGSTEPGGLSRQLPQVFTGPEDQALGLRKTNKAHLSSWAIPRWMAMAGKFCSTKSWDRAMQRCTDLTKITTYRQDREIYSSTHVHLAWGTLTADAFDFKCAPQLQSVLETELCTTLKLLAYLVELQHIEQVEELAVLLTVL